MNELIINEEKIENLIYEINGIQIMLDSDLARLYKCKNGTKEINQAVKNNMSKFPERFSWKLSDNESKFFWSKILTKKIEKRGGRYKNPRVFTEQGIAMLATILKTEVATETSIKIMDAFVLMRHYIGNNEYRLSNVETKIIEHDSEIKLLQKSFNKMEEKKKYNEIYFNGQIFDAYFKILEIFKKAKKELLITDSYADISILDIIKKLKIKVTIITSKKYITDKDIEMYNKQYNNLKIIYDDTFHDRYFILDKKIIYHCGSSINRIGYKTFSINLISDNDVIKYIVKRINEIIKKI